MKNNLQALTLFMKRILCYSRSFERYQLMNSYPFQPLEPEYTPCDIEVVYDESRQCR